MSWGKQRRGVGMLEIASNGCTRKRHLECITILQHLAVTRPSQKGENCKNMYSHDSEEWGASQGQLKGKKHCSMVIGG